MRLTSQAKLSGNICTVPPDIGADNVNFIFLVDMSGSNIYKDGKISTGTDVPGQRLNLLDSFLNEECLEKYRNKKFAVVGFSDEILNLKGRTGCDANFLTGDPEEVKAQVQALRAIQEDVIAKNLPETSGQNPMTETYYKQALDCNNSIIEDQLNDQPDEAKKDFTYFTFFITDGAPTDDNSLGMSINLSNVDQAITRFNSYFSASLNRLRHLTNEVGGGGRLQPILYGFDQLIEVKKRLALGVLTNFANVGESQLKNINQISDLKLCDLLTASSKIPYAVKKFGVVNLTATADKGLLKADSDMDGLIDELEVDLGFDPQKRRSQWDGNEVLDGLCFGLAAKDCTTRSACGESNEMGLNACDLESYGLTDGIDSDQDDIPDLVEILKLTRPNVDDTMFNNDGDELYLYQEIAVGRSPNYKDDNVSPLTLMEYTNNKSPTPLNGCPENQESWSYIIDQVPLVPTIATNNIYEADLRLDFLNHDTDENIIFIYYIIKELNNSDASTSLLFGKFIKVNYDTGEKQELSEFKQLGVVDGEF